MVDTENILGWREAEGFSSDDKVDIRHSREAFAIDDVFTLIVERHSRFLECCGNYNLIA